MVMWMRYDPKEETRPEWLSRCVGSGMWPGPRWARAVRWALTAARVWSHRLHRLRIHMSGRTTGTYRDSDLLYAAGARCRCGCGLAYPVYPQDFWGKWSCSAVLKGTQTDGQHEEFPFSMYEIKSENQPSARGKTTRPNVSYVRHGLCGSKFVRSL